MNIVIPILSFSKSGGARVLSKLADEWIKRGFVVQFYVAQQESVPGFPTGAQIKRGRCSSRDGVSAQMLELRRMLLSEEEKIDIVFANYHLTAWVVWSCGKNIKSKSIYYSQAYEVDFYDGHKSYFRGRVLAALAKASYRILPRVIVNAPIYMDYEGINALDWVPPGLDFDIYHPRESNLELKTNPIVVGCIGRPAVWKGTWDVFSAVRILSKNHLDIRLRCAFFCPNEFSDLAEVVENPLPNNDQELADFYRSCDVIIAPGHVQLGAPHYPVMEAMACGIPVVTTGYMPADSRNSWIVPIKNPAKLAEAVLEIVRSPDLVDKRVKAALDDISVFSWSEVASKFVEIFQRCGLMSERR